MHTARDPRHLLLTPLGRQQLLWGTIFRSWHLLRPLARLYRGLFLRRTRFAVVVGSYGKTTATRATMAALDRPYVHHTGWNSRGFIPLGILLTNRHAPYCVLEAGIREQGWMARYARLVRPDVVVATSIGSEHGRTLGTLEETRDEKSKILRDVPQDGLVVLNGDDENVRWMGTQTRARVVTVGLGEGNDVRASDIRIDRFPPRTRFRVHVDGRTHSTSTPLIGEGNVRSVLAAFAVAVHEGVPTAKALSALEELRPAPERLQPLRTTSGVVLLLDTRKGAIETIEVGAEVLREMPAERKVAVLGDIEEPPGPQGPLYQRVAGRLASVVDLILFVGGSTAYASVATGAGKAGFPREKVLYAGRSTREAIAMLQGRVDAGDVVWIKGRSTQHLGRIGLALAGRNVTCDVTFCSHTPTCELCPMLERPTSRSFRSTSARRRS